MTTRKPSVVGNQPTDDDRSTIRRLFPEVEQLEDRNLADKVIEIWAQAWKTSNWPRVEDAFKNPDTVQLRHKLITHSRCVANQAVAMATTIGDFHGFDVNLDFVIAGSLLHDVSKLLEFDPEGTSGGKTSPFGRLIQHGAYGVHLGFAYDLPVELIHIIGSHTMQSRLPPRTIEAVIVHYADYVDSDVLLLESGHQLFLGYAR